MRRVTAIILGGGKGERLMPLTSERAKPAVSFAGKYRLIDIPISNCINSGIRRQFVLTQFLSASLHRHIMQTFQFGAFSDGFIDILAAEQTTKGADWFQGTADAVRATLNHTTYYDCDLMLILAGDHLYRMDYGELIDFHRRTKADITLSVYPVPLAEASQLGLLKADAKGEVIEYAEKPKDPAVIDNFRAPASYFEAQGIEVAEDRCLASMGIYVFEPKVLKQLLADPSRTDFGNEVIPAAIGKQRVMAFPFTDYWKDIGTIRAFYEANIALAHPDPPFNLYAPGWPVHTHNRSLPPSRIIGSEIRDSLIIQGTNITGARISDSIIGMRGMVGKGSRLDGVVMLGADFYEDEEVLDPDRLPVGDVPPLGIGRNCTIERAIIDKNARIGNDVHIRARPDTHETASDTHWVRDGITIIPKGVVIPDGTRL